MFDENPRHVPFYIPLICFASAALFYGWASQFAPELKEYALIPLPLGGLTLSIYLRTRHHK